MQAGPSRGELDEAASSTFVPWFVHVDEAGRPDYRIVGAGKVREATERGLCFTCGRPLEGPVSFVLSPSDALARRSGEPPHHRYCAELAAVECPFLSDPDARRRLDDLPPGARAPRGGLSLGNEGSTVIYRTSSYTVELRGDSARFELGPPLELELWHAGRIVEGPGSCPVAPAERDT